MEAKKGGTFPKRQGQVTSFGERGKAASEVTGREVQISNGMGKVSAHRKCGKQREKAFSD